MLACGGWRLSAWLTVWLGVLLLIGAGVATRLAANIRCVDVPFSAQGWLRGDARERGRMVNDLVHGGWLGCLSRSEIVAMLGTPDADHGHEVRYAVDTGVRLFK